MTSKTWTVLNLLETTSRYLTEKGMSSPRLDAELLMGRVLNMSRVQLYCAFDKPLSNIEIDAYRSFVKRRAKGEPVAYLLGEKEFYSLPFYVDRSVLIPRPETEHLVDRALEILAAKPESHVIDLGTGSGAIAIAVAAHCPAVDIAATDISPDSLFVALKNAEKQALDTRIRFVQGDLFASEKGPFDLVLSNPPYIDKNDCARLMPDVLDFEPPDALFAPESGLGVIRRIIEEAPERCADGATMLMEIGYDQADRVLSIVENTARYKSASLIKDYSGKRRILELRL